MTDYDAMARAARAGQKRRKLAVIHRDKDKIPIWSDRCSGVILGGRRCRRPRQQQSPYCFQHMPE